MNIKNFKKKCQAPLFWKIVPGTIFFILVGVLFSACQKEAKSKQVCFKNKCFDVEIALTQEEQIKGFQFRKELDKNSGMLFVFSDLQNHYFWMKDTLIFLDMIWLDQNRQVVHIEENVPPCTKDPCKNYSGIKSSLYVLEINPGLARRNNIQVGDQADIRTSHENSQ